jgi:phosphoglycolate phosphatase
VVWASPGIGVGFRQNEIDKTSGVDVNAVVFDLDGTLIDSAPDLKRAADQTLEDFGCRPLDEHEFRLMIGGGVSALVTRFLAARQCGAPEGAALTRFLDHYESTLATLTRPYPGTQEMLRALSARGLRLGICTNKLTRLARLILERFDLAQYFHCVLGGDALPYRKPDPRVLIEVFNALGGSAASSLFVGDSEVDAATAAAAQVPFILMTHGYHRGPVGEIRSVAALDHFEQLVPWLDAKR